jgi:hypothetical protein
MTNHPPIIGPTATRFYNDGRNTIVQFRDIEVVRISYLDVRLDSGGSRSFIIRSQLNQASRQFGLDYHVHLQEGAWGVETSRGLYRFVDGMHLRRSTGRDHEYVEYEASNGG